MDAADCERTWRNVLRPEINRDKWTGAEEADLQVLVEKYNMRNWTQIAEELGVSNFIKVKRDCGGGRVVRRCCVS